MIEERDGKEITSLFYEKPIAPEAELITAIVTEKGICRYPYTQSLSALFGGE